MSGPPRGILVLDMSYTLTAIRERQLDQALESRNVGGYFTAVISAHPLAGLLEAPARWFGQAIVTRVNDSQFFVEGKVGRTRWLKALPPLNFVLAQIGLLKLLVRMSRQMGVQVVRVGDPYYLGVMGWLVAKWLDVPLAIRVPFRYDEIRRITGRPIMPRLFRFQWIEKAIERFVFRRCDLIAGANADNMQYAIENEGRADVATVFRYGNLLHASHWAEPADRSDADGDLKEIGLAGKPFVMTVARLEPMKRVEDAIRAVGDLIRRGSDIHLLIVGDGADRQRLIDYTAALGLEQAVVFAGNRNQEWIARVLPRAAAIVSPHMGRALVEAALAGVPIVAFDYDWQREIVVDDETGYLVANGDWRAMAERTETLLNNPTAAQEIGRRARIRVAAMMDPAALMRHEQATYSQLLERWASRRPSPAGVPTKASTR